MLASTPPMGWNSWNTFGADISEELIKETADAMVALGYREAGYEYVVIDDCWSLKERDSQGRLQADPQKFPSGMKALADYIHSKGLKFGMYSCCGVQTCAGYPGSFDHEFVDAQTFADWGVDYLKYDYCHKPEHILGDTLYYRMAMALRASGREILFSACNWGANDSRRWMRSAGAHIYRSTGDIVDNYQSFHDIAMAQQSKLASSAPGCFNDMDMLVVGMHGKGNVGVGGCTDAEYRMHFALWCLFNSPLMIGCDIRSLDETSHQLLLNAGLIAINQDKEARPPHLITNPNDTEKAVYFRMLDNNEYALGLFNFRDDSNYILTLFADIGLPVSAGHRFELTDVFTGETIHAGGEAFPATLAAHDCKVYRVRLVKQ